MGPLLETDRLGLRNASGAFRHLALVSEPPSIFVHCLPFKVPVVLPWIGGHLELALVVEADGVVVAKLHDAGAKAQIPPLLGLAQQTVVHLKGMVGPQLR